MIRRTSRSSIVRQRAPAAGANGGVPLTMASASALSVRTCRPRQVGRAVAHLLLGALVEGDEAHRAPAAGASRASRWRARSVSTRVLPEPAGAMIRAAPPSWVTAASWSGARSAAVALAAASGRSEPCSMATRWSTAHPSIGGGEPDGPAVDPHSPAIRHDDIARSAIGHRRGTEPNRPIEQQPAADVHGVARHQVVQRLQVEGEACPELVRRPIRCAVCGDGEAIEHVSGRLDDQAPPRAAAERRNTSIVAATSAPSSATRSTPLHSAGAS